MAVLKTSIMITKPAVRRSMSLAPHAMSPCYSNHHRKVTYRPGAWSRIRSTMKTPGKVSAMVIRLDDLPDGEPVTHKTCYATRCGKPDAPYHHHPAL